MLIKFNSTLKPIDMSSNLNQALASLSFNDSTADVQSILLQKSQIKPAYLDTKEFFQSISQTALIAPSESLSNDLNDLEIIRQDLLTKAYVLMTEYSLVYNWLPREYSFTKSGLSKLLQWLEQIQSMFKGSSDLNIRESLINICQNYSAEFNKNFKLEMIKIKSNSSSEETNLQELLQNKIMALGFERSSVDEKIASLNSRRSNIPFEAHTEQTDILENLSFNHDMIEMNFFAFIGNEVSSAEGSQQQVNIPIKTLTKKAKIYLNSLQNNQSTINYQIFEAFTYVVLQFLNDNLQKWIMMENASLEAKEHLCTLTSIDGDWFLEEMLSLVVNCNHLTNLIRSIFTKYNRLNETNLSFNKSLDICDNLANVFANIKNLTFGFEVELFPKLIQLCMHDVHEVESTSKQIDNFNINEFLELITRSDFLIETFEQDSDCMEKFAEIKSNYAQLLSNKTSML